MKEMISRTNLEISKHIEIPKLTPSVIVAVAPCRSGTTAQLRVFAEAGAQAHYQPLKAILRELEAGKSLDFQIPEGNNRTIFIKETVGPYNEAQSTLDPIEILLATGFPIEKIHLVAMLRQPLATFASWIKVNEAVEKYFNGAIPVDDLLENLITSYKTVNSVKKSAERAGIPTTTFVQESLRDNKPEDVVRALVESCGLKFTETTARGWNSLIPMGEPGSNIIFHPIGTEPEKDKGSQIIHSILLHSDGLKYISKEDKDIDVIANHQAKKIFNSELYEIYESFRVSAQKDLNITIEPSKERDNYQSRKVNV